MRYSFYFTLLVMFCSFGKAAPSGPAGKTGTVNDLGRIAGKVTYAGPVTTPKKLEISKDVNICGKIEHFDQTLLVSKDRGLANVVVSVSGVKVGRSLDSWGNEFSIVQSGCQFAPHVLLLPVGVKLEIKNNDGILHNIHTYSEKNQPMNKAQPRFLKVLTVAFDQPEIVRVACDVHAWMNSYLVVVDHPYYAVTDENGNFELTDVPSGTYRIEYWHESLGKHVREVTVKNGETVNIDYEF